MNASEVIWRKWRAQGVFYRFLDGDNTNRRAANMKQVTLKEALVNINSWVCDWDIELTPQEIQIVHNAIWRYQIIQRL